MNWDDLKVLLALSRHGSTRKAAKALQVSNTTVLRRLESLEEAIEGRLFDRTPDGLRATTLCEQLLPIAKSVEDTITDGQRQLTGRDSELVGKLKVSIAQFSVISAAFFQQLNAFALKYPRIQLDINGSDTLVDLARREADFAIRGLPIGGRPPKDIVGIKLGRLSAGYYIHRDLLIEAQLGRKELTYIGSGEPYPAGLPTPEQLGLREHHVIDSFESRLDGIKSQMGLGRVPCFAVQDSPDILRLPNTPTVPFVYVWLLYHKDLRQSARVRALFEHLARLENEWPTGWDTSISQ